MTPEQIGALLSTAFGGGILGKMLDKGWNAYKESKSLKEAVEDKLDRALRSRNMYREENAKTRLIAVEHGAHLDPLPPDPYDE